MICRWLGEAIAFLLHDALDVVSMMSVVVIDNKEVSRLNQLLNQHYRLVSHLVNRQLKFCCFVVTIRIMASYPKVRFADQSGFLL